MNGYRAFSSNSIHYNMFSIVGQALAEIAGFHGLCLISLVEGLVNVMMLPGMEIANTGRSYRLLSAKALGALKPKEWCVCVCVCVNLCQVYRLELL